MNLPTFTSSAGGGGGDRTHGCNCVSKMSSYCPRSNMQPLISSVGADLHSVVLRLQQLSNRSIVLKMGRISGQCRHRRALWGARSCVDGLSASSQSSPVPRPTWPSPTSARAPSSCSSNPATTARPPSPAGRWRPRWVRRGPRGPRWRPGPFRCQYLSVWLFSGGCGGRERGVGAGPPGVQRA